MKNINDLIILRARQLKRRNENLTKTIDMMKRMREIKKIFDDDHEIFDKNIKNDDLILLHEIRHQNDKNSIRKLKYK